jgi:hypothetical protein
MLWQAFVSPLGIGPERPRTPKAGKSRAEDGFS